MRVIECFEHQIKHILEYVIAVFFTILIFLNVNVDVHAKELATITITTESGLDPTCDYVSCPEGCWGKSITNNEYINCTIIYYNPDEDVTILDQDAQIKIRGNTSAYGGKKPYKLKLSKKKAFGTTGNSKKWVLLKGGTDLKFLFSNWTAAYCGGSWYPKFEYVNVIVNDDYKGCYILAESVEQISKDLDFDETGFLIENDAYWWNSESYFKVNNQIPQLGFTFKEPDYEDLSESQVETIKNIVNVAIDSICKNDDYEYLSYIDISGFASWYLAKDYMNNTDGGGSNMYWYSRSTGGVLNLGPAWDFDTDYANDVNRWSPAHNNKNNFAPYLFKKATFKKAYRNEFEKSKNILKDLTAYIEDYLNTYGESIQESWNRDAERWRNNPGSVEEQKKDILEYYSERYLWIKENTMEWSLDYSVYDEVMVIARAIDGSRYENYGELQALLDIDVYDISFTQDELDNLTENIQKTIDDLQLIPVQTEIIGAPYRAIEGQGVYDVNIPHVIINQVYGGKKKESYASHSFIELYNQSEEDVDLTGWSLQYRSSIDGGENEKWGKLILSGIIPSHRSYLIRCASIKNPVEGSIVIANYDQEWNQVINNKGCSIVLVANNKTIPADSIVFDNETGTPVIFDYVDMVGVSGNDTDTEENIANEAALFYEKEASPIQSKKNGIRREKLKDTDNNAEKADFIAVDYSFVNVDYIAYISPRCVADGAWVYDKNAVPRYTVTFVEDESKSFEENFKYNTKVDKPEAPEKDGYTFTGWFTDEECTKEYNFKTKPIEDITLYAGWTPTEYSITYENVEGATNTNVISYTIEDEDITLVNPEKDGSIFYGWYDNAGCLGDPVTVVSTADIGDKILYAKWKDIVTPVVTLEDWTYGDVANTPVVTASVSVTGSAITFKYKAKGAEDSEYTENAPTEAGIYTVRATVSETDDYVFDVIEADFTVDRAQANVKAVDASKVYGDIDPGLYAEVFGLKGTDTAEIIAYDIYRSSGEAVGSYTMLPTGDTVQGNYDVVYTTGTFTIDKKIVTDPVIVLSEDTYTYDGDEKAPEVTVRYGNKVIDPSEYTVSITNNTYAGTATVTVSDKVGGNYDVSGSTTFTISKAVPVITTKPTAGTLNFGQALSDSALTGATASVAGVFAWDDGEIVPSVANSNLTEYTVVFTPTDTDNYENVKIGVKVAVDKADPTGYSLPVGLMAVYGDILSDISLPDGWSWADGSVSVGDVGSHSFAAIYTPVDTVNFNSANVMLDVSVTKDAPVLTVPTAKLNLVYNGSAQELVNSSVVSGGAISFALVSNASALGTDIVPEASEFSSGIPTAVSAGNYTVWYKVVGDANHLDTEPANINVTISRASAVVYATNTGKIYGDADPVLEGTVSGLKGCDDQSAISYSLMRSAGEDIGTYNIVPIGEAVQENYNVAFVSGVFTVEAKSVSNPVIVLSQTEFKYDGTAKRPSVTVMDGSKVIDASEYTVSYSENINPGTATVAITDREGGNYTVNGSITYIIGKAETEFTAPVVKSNLVYNGSAQELITANAVNGGTIYFAVVNQNSLSNGAGSIENVGTGTGAIPADSKFSTVVPAGISAGDYIVWYKIVGDDNHLSTEPVALLVNITRASVTVSVNNCSKTFGEADPELSAEVSGLKENDTQDGLNFDLFRSAGESVGTYKIFAMGDAVQGNYNVSFTQGTFTIGTKVVSDQVITLSNDSFVYDGTEKTPSVTVRVGNTIVDSNEYSVSYSDNVNVGTATVTITDKVGGNYEISGIATFTITKAESKIDSLPTANIGLVADDTKQELISVGLVSGGVLEYAIGSSDVEPADTAYSTAIPTGKEAGVYKVWYRVVGDSNHSDIAPAYVTVTIAEPEVQDGGDTQEENHGNGEEQSQGENQGESGNQGQNENQGENENQNQGDSQGEGSYGNIQGENSQTNNQGNDQSENQSGNNSSNNGNSGNGYDNGNFGSNGGNNDTTNNGSGNGQSGIVVVPNVDTTNNGNNSANTNTDNGNKDNSSDSGESKDGNNNTGNKDGSDSNTGDGKDGSGSKDENGNNGNGTENGVGTDTNNDGTEKVKTDNSLQKPEYKIAVNSGFKVTQTDSKLMISWGRVKGAEGYDVYVAYRGDNYGNPVKSVNAAFNSTSISKLAGAKIDTKKNYKVYVVAYKMDGNTKYILGKSIVGYIAGKNSESYTNVSKIKLNKTKVKLEVGQKFTIKATAVLKDSDKKELSISKVKEFRFISSDTSVATVTSAGKIKAKGKGTCYIYVYAKNGKANKVKVTVK